MRVGIVDADLLDHGTRHPNLALMKISGWYNNVHREIEGDILSKVIYPTAETRCARLVRAEDLSSCQTLDQLVGESSKSLFNKLVISKVFDFSKLPPLLQEAMGMGLLYEGTGDEKDYSSATPRMVYGGTGFVEGLSRLPNKLPDKIEHHFPDYHLYDDYVDDEINKHHRKAIRFKDYKNYSIGFLTRGCFRRCAFCVNKYEKSVKPHSHVVEFFDPDRKYIYLWDDNFLGFIHHADKDASGDVNWETLLNELVQTGRAFQFRQGLDMRLMTNEIAKRLSHCRYHGDYIFAFDHIQDREIIARNIDIWRKYNTKLAKFYVLCGFDSVDEMDIANTFKRIKILMEHRAIPYIMRHENYKKSKYAGLYVQLARWCNQPQFFKKKSFREYCERCQEYYIEHGGGKKNAVSAPLKALKLFEKDHPQIAGKYFDIRFDRNGH